MYSDTATKLEAMISGYLSACNPEQVLEAKDVLKKIISDIENVNLTQEKDTDSTAETEEKQHRTPKIPLTDSLVQLIYNTAKKFPNYTFSKLEEKLNLTNGYIKNQRRVIVFKGRKTRLSAVVKLARLMDEKNLSRYEREENYIER